MPPPRPASLKVRALQWLSQREHSRSELRDKLLRLLDRGGDAVTVAVDASAPAEASLAVDAAADPQAEVDALLVWLEQRGYLSDARFAEAKVQSRQDRYGNRRIQQELRQRGITLDAGTEAELAGSEFGRAWAVWQRKYSAPPTDAAERVRQLRFLVGRGFSMDVVQRVLRQAAERPREPDDDTSR